ncbi:hypothetical protein L6307_00615 [Candidatus Parcubacteria bacterium]|nr:hypothetical protein [Candidatus Parcubacteria bacterium]
MKSEIAKGWKMTTLGEVLTIKHGFAFSGENITDQENENILLTPGNFLVGGGWKDEKKYFNGEIPCDYVLKKGNLIVTMTDLSKDGDILVYPALIPDRSDKNLFTKLLKLVIIIISRKKPLYYILYTIILYN